MPMSGRAFLGCCAGTTLGGAAAAAYARAIEPHWIEVTERVLHVRGLAPALAGARLVQVSDLHVSPWVDERYLVRCLERVRGLYPDLLVVTGDILGAIPSAGDEAYERLSRVLAHVPRARLATCAVLGNHDYGAHWAQPRVAARVARQLEGVGITVLRNACLAVGGLDIVGVDDLWARRADPRRALAQRTSEAAIALCHNPDALDACDWGDYRGYVLAGHTHGGQCRPPFLPPPVLPVRNKRYSAGVVDAGHGRTLYVNRGLGHLQRIRFNVRPEITRFTLRARESVGDGPETGLS